MRNLEKKVRNASAVSIAVGLAMWLLESYVFGGQVPGPVAEAVAYAVPGIVAFVVGWVTEHTQRLDLHEVMDHVRDG